MAPIRQRADGANMMMKRRRGGGGWCGVGGGWDKTVGPYAPVRVTR